MNALQTMKHFQVLAPLLLLVANAAALFAQENPPVQNAGGAVPKAPILQAETSWIGNTFGGANERWVQVWVDEIEVSSDGSVYTASDWDEAGRCTGVYKNGDVNATLLKQYDGKGGHKSWGWGTASLAVAIDARNLYILNLDGEIVRFDRATLKYLDTTPALEIKKENDKPVGVAHGMACANGVLAIVRDGGEVQVRRTDDLKTVASTWQVPGARDVAIDRRGRLWILAGAQVLAFSREGKALPNRVSALEPSAIAIDAQGRLLVCDNAPSRRQVLAYDVQGAPRLAATFGVPRGIAAGSAGSGRARQAVPPRGSRDRCARQPVRRAQRRHLGRHHPARLCSRAPRSAPAGASCCGRSTATTSWTTSSPTRRATA
jgi:hypothetical protein